MELLKPIICQQHLLLGATITSWDDALMFNGLDAACRKVHALQEHLNQDGGKICIERYIRVEPLTQSTMIEKQRTGSAWCVVLKLKFVDPHWPLSDFGFTGCLVMPPNFPSFHLSFEICRETQSWLVIYMTTRRNSLILSTSYKHTPGNMTIDGLDSVTYFCRGRSFHDFPTQRPHPHWKPPRNARSTNSFLPRKALQHLYNWLLVTVTYP